MGRAMMRVKEGDAMPVPHVLADGEGEALWFFGSLILFKATAAQTGGHFCLVEQYGPRGMATPLHRQPAAEETFTVLEGQLRFFLAGGDPIMAGPGATVYIPAGTAHAFDVQSESARWLDLTTGSHEAFFRAAGEPARARTLPPEAAPDMAKVAAAGQAHGLEILGPPPGETLTSNDAASTG
jgi:quercetin dioxygenase-like cupin family protein